MRLFKQTYRDRKGTTRETSKFYCEFRDLNGDPRRLALFTDRSASADAARNVGRLLACRAAGEAPDLALTRWFETMPRRTRGRLVAIGLLTARRVASAQPLATHLADFTAALRAKGNTEAHVVLVEARARRIIEGCGFKFWSDVTAGKVQTFLIRLRKGELQPAAATERKEARRFRAVSAQTFNYYLASLKAFCRWMIRDGRASESPVAHLSALNARTDRRHHRRALSVDELRRLLEAARTGPERFGMSGPERAILYRVAVETGLRAGELRSLTRGSFRIEGREPTVTVAAGYSKRRREDVLPIRPELAEALGDFLGVKVPSAPAFTVPARWEVPRMLRADLAAARSGWLCEGTDVAERALREAMDFLSYRDAAGRVADFHALRHTFLTLLAAGGVHPKTAQSLARHSTITLTMDRYSHTLRGAESAALAVLPDLDSPARRVAATGTDPAALAPTPREMSGRPAGRFLLDSGRALTDSAGLSAGAASSRAVSPKGLDSPEFSADSGDEPATVGAPRWGGRVVECAGLEIR